MEGGDERGYVWGNKRNTGFRRKESGVGGGGGGRGSGSREVAGRWEEKVQ